ncbi:MAG: nitroreductase [Flavobacteriales bacterium]|nr:nitroreductase [Flavobacteriales bacterium]
MGATSNGNSMKYNLSEITEVIKNRRSIRPEDYSARKVHREIVENVLSNATWAPTHGMTQPWRFKVFMGDGLQRLSSELPALYKDVASEDTFSQRKFDKIQQRMQNISVVVAICMERDRDEKIPEIEEVEAVACAVQNMYLTCTAYGVGGFWSSPKFVYTEEMNELLGIKSPDRCLGLFYMGYPEGDWPKSHRKPLEYVTEWIDE